MENRTIIAVVLTIALLIAWQFFMPAKTPQRTHLKTRPSRKGRPAKRL